MTQKTSSLRRVALASAALICAAAASLAATDVLGPAEPGIVTIEVAPHELAECRETLAQVAATPAVADNGSPLFFDRASDLPQVQCVAVSDA
ncbi:hypothetical protein [Roseivivax isoporae]|uniref:Uncharacterized protein n=1 Tax=Roseivivax isoporae LMG 25204 TaxID=1449351 RepID=X7F3I4_9RHOB|nr:hypothetical protein [Roseivivax isoporae]ETX27370.1 hypothetical protein RISW2_14335 [Roseivivax isoporae LMG 25204]